MAVLNALCGGLTSTGFKVLANIPTGTSARLVVTPPGSASVYFGPVTINASTRTASFTATGLTARTDYTYAFEVDGVRDAGWIGKARTTPTPGTQASFRFVVSSCAGHANSGDGTTDWYPAGQGATGVSNRSTFDLITASGGDFFAHLGDMHYRDYATTDPTRFAQAIDDVLAAPRQAALYRSKALVYMTDDHDGYGGDNRDKTSVGTSVGRQAYRDRIPSHPLTDATGLWQTWVHGRVRFILTDNRNERDPCINTDNATKSMLGATQKAWFKATLLAATEPVIVWLNPLTWNGAAVAGGDSWFGYTTERAELGKFIRDNGIGRKLICISGDSHVNGIDDGRSNADGGFPEITAGSIDAAPGSLPDSWSHGWAAGRGRFGVFDVIDNGNVIQVVATLMHDDVVERTLSVIKRVTAPKLAEVTTNKILVSGTPTTIFAEKALGDLSLTPFKIYISP